MSSVAARFFTPQISGAGATPSASTGVFRIDHDEAFNMTAHMQYQTPWKRGPWFGFNWRYDSGLVAGSVPCYGISDFNSCGQSTMLDGQPAIMMTDASGIPFTADQEFQAGFTCNGVHATPTVALPFTCLASQFGSTLTKVPRREPRMTTTTRLASGHETSSTWRSEMTTCSRRTNTSGARR